MGKKDQIKFSYTEKQEEIFLNKNLPFYAKKIKNLILQRNIEIRCNGSGLAIYNNSNNLNWFLGENSNTVCFSACKLWLIQFGILLFPTEVLRWAGLELKDVVFKCKERSFCVFKLHKFLFKTHFPDFVAGRKHTCGKAVFYLKEEEGTGLCLMTFYLSSSKFRGFFRAFHHSLYKLELLLAYHF